MRAKIVQELNAYRWTGDFDEARGLVQTESLPMITHTDDLNDAIEICDLPADKPEDYSDVLFLYGSDGGFKGALPGDWITWENGTADLWTDKDFRRHCENYDEIVKARGSK